MGAQTALVGSSRQFYYNIGFHPHPYGELVDFPETDIKFHRFRPPTK